MVASPRAVFREAATRGFIDNPDVWFKFLEARNLTAHTYVEAVAEQVYGVVKDSFLTAVNGLLSS